MRKRRTREEKIKAKTRSKEELAATINDQPKEDFSLIIHDLIKTGLIAFGLLAALAAINFLKA